MKRTFGSRGAPRPKVCRFCVERIGLPDYKEVNILRRYITTRGKILPARSTGACAYHQRKLTTAIKRARYLALMPFTVV